MNLDVFKAWYAEQFLSLKEAWSKFTVKWNALLIAAGVGWNLLPADAQNKIVESVLTAMKIPTSWAVVVIGVIGLFLRMKLQKPKDEE